MRVAIAIAGLALGIAAYLTQIHYLPTTHLHAAMSVAAGWSFLAAGMAAWARRPGNRLGPIMLIAAFALLARQLRYSHDEILFTMFFALGELGYALVIQAVLAYPSGVVRDRLERAFLAVAYTVALAFPLAILLFDDGTQPLRYFDPRPRESFIWVDGDMHVVRVLQDSYAVIGYGVIAGVFILLIARRLWKATPRSRRILAPLLLAGVVAALRAVFDSLLTFSVHPPVWVLHNLFWWQILGLIALPIALLAGMLRARLAQASVGDLVVRLERAPANQIRNELASALDDPTLEVALWLPDRREFVDEEGRGVHVPEDGPLRAVTKLENDGHPLAALIHDPGLRDEPELVAAAAAAARLALENARLQAELHLQLAKVKESRARIVAAADEERRRIERDLHDGLQQRLVAIALDFRDAQRRLGQDADPEIERLLASSAGELKVAVQELRELARGIHPAILTEGGLAAAIESVTSRSSLPVEVHATSERFPAEIEAAAYFLVCEGLNNVAKHADATRVRIDAARKDSTLVVAVSDDGVGGAKVNGGSGLRGLTDRIEAHGGRLHIESDPVKGTRLVGEIPCGS